MRLFRHFFSCGRENLNIVATYNLLYNGSLMVEEGMGYAISFDKRFCAALARYRMPSVSPAPMVISPAIKLSNRHEYYL